MDRNGQTRRRLSPEEDALILESRGVACLKNSSAKILLFDIETAPMRSYLWSKWQQGINDNAIITDWFILCWSAKWLFSDEILSSKLNKKELPKGNDRRITKNLWQLMDEADIIIAHNLMKFDLKKANTKFLQYNLGRPSPFNTIDTLLHARKQFAITSNKLDYIAKNFFGIEGKLQTERNLWNRCMEGDMKALQFMSLYCDQDVRVLEDVYLCMRGWITPHPNVGLQSLSLDGGCNACSSVKRESTKTPYRTYVSIYDSYRCKNCGHIYRSRRSKKNLGDKGVSLPK